MSAADADRIGGDKTAWPPGSVHERPILCCSAEGAEAADGAAETSVLLTVLEPSTASEPEGASGAVLGCRTASIDSLHNAPHAP